MNSHYLNMGPSSVDAERRADKSYPDLQQIVWDFARFAVIVGAAGSVAVAVVYSLFWILT